MKTSRLFGLSLSLCLLVSATTHAQTEPAAPAGYWNLETNRTTRDYTTVRFYNAHDQPVYEERLDGQNLDLRKGNRCCRRTRQQRSAALATVLRDPAAARHDARLLARQLGPARRVQRAYAFR